MKKRSSQQYQLMDLINNLTVNEDERQDLWLSYLSGTPTSDLPSRLDYVTLDDIEELKPAVQSLLANPLPQELLNVIETFPDLEKNIIFFLALGLSIDSISGYKKLSTMKVEQTLHTIQKSSHWKTYLDGIKDKIHGPRGIRSHPGRA